jgi:hypothetical protein
MINKKILAVAVAAVFSTNTFAADGALDAVFPDLSVAQQSLPTLVDGNFTITNQTVTNDLGFSIADTTIKYVRYDIVNGLFNTITGVTGATLTTTLSAGGDGETFAIFEVLAGGADLPQTHDVVLTSTFDVSGTASATIEYNLFETAAAAVAKTSSLSDDTGTFSSVVDVMTGAYIAPVDLVATVASGFDLFAVGGGTGVLGAGDVDGVLVVGSFQPDGSVFAAVNIVDAAATVTFTGDFSFGTFDYGADQWTTDADGDLAIAGGGPTFNEDGTVTVGYVQAEALSVITGGEVAKKGTYSVTIDGITFDVGNADAYTATGTVGTISYDTTSISIPFLTTFADNNQKIYIVNTGPEAAYTTTFLTEPGVTATDGVNFEGTVPENGMLQITARDLVTFTGDSTRGSATIEIEAIATAIQATSQLTNTVNKGSDLTILVVE